MRQYHRHTSILFESMENFKADSISQSFKKLCNVLILREKGIFLRSRYTYSGEYNVLNNDHRWVLLSLVQSTYMNNRTHINTALRFGKDFSGLYLICIFMMFTMGLVYI